MIKKINTIQNIGSYKSFFTGTNNSYEFDKKNIFYGLNGSGKSTLAAILNSLKRNDPELILGKKTIGSKKNPHCVLEFDNQNFLFKEGKWSSPDKELPPNLFIFDEDFIESNIFAQKCEIDHKKKICKVILGEEGTIKTDELANLRNEKDNLVKKISSLTNRENFEEFLKINPDKLDKDNINKKIKEVKKTLLNLNQKTKILNKEILKQINFKKYDFAKIKTEFTKKLEDVHKEAKKKVEGFKDKYFDNPSDAEKFLKLGLDNQKGDCSFCHKPLEEDLISLYESYFNKEYESLIASYNSLIKEFSKYNPESIINEILNGVETNKTLHKNWSQTIENLIKIETKEEDLRKLKKEIELIKEKIIEDLDSKLKNIKSDLNMGNIEKMEDNFISISKILEEYNSNISKINKEIESFKESFGKIIYSSEEKRLSKLELELSRFDNAPLCTRYFDNEIKIEKKKKEIEEYNKNLVTNHKDKINEFLKLIGVSNFKISNIVLKNTDNANDSYVELEFDLMGENISMSKNAKKGKRDFKNTLSRGEKNALAFSFFLAQIDKTENKEDLIIILDDPLSSLDENRLNSTTDVIKRLSGKVKQICVLTHNKRFFEIIAKMFSNEETKYFNIKKDSSGSVISLINIKQFLMPESDRLFDKLSHYSESGLDEGVTIGNLQNDIRKLFENSIRTKYRRIIKNENRPLMQYSTLNDNFFQQNIFSQEIREELEFLAGISNNGSHWSENGTPNEDEIKNILKRSLELIEGI